MKNIILQSNQWYQNNNIAVRGYCFDSENNFYDGEKLLQLFAAVKNENNFRQLLQSVNGIFSIVIQTENYLFAASDKSRVIPLFYSFENEIFSISDNPYNLLSEVPKIDSKAEQEFLLSSFMLDEKTLIEGVFQIKPSAYLCVENGEVSQKEYYSYCVKNSELNKSQTLEKDFSAVLENVFRRLIKSVNGRQIVVPLSGGYDSRLIAAMLKKLDYHNVVCYTVGRENNSEYLIAKEVARLLYYPYHFIFTGDKKFVENYTEDETFLRYYKFSGSFFQSFWMYEYFGVKHLIENNLIEKNAIFVPGHSGDFLAGSQTTKMNILENDSKKQLVKKIDKYICVFGKSKQKHLKKISQIIDYQRDFVSYSVFDNFLLKSRLPYVPNNAARLYEFFGYYVRLPFWDNEILEFFRTLPPNLKYNKLFYNNYLKNNLFNAYNVNFEKELQVEHKTNPLKPLKDFFKPFMPKFVFRLVSKYQDDTCMKEISAPLVLDLKKNKINLKTIFPNEIFVKWYLMKLREEIVNNS